MDEGELKENIKNLKFKKEQLEQKIIEKVRRNMEKAEEQTRWVLNQIVWSLKYMNGECVNMCCID